jgi:O-Antigen ligase
VTSLSATLRFRIAAAAGAAALAAGALASLSPKLALGVLAFALLVVFALRAPVAHLLLLLAVAIMVPPEILNEVSVGGGVGSAGLLPTDVLLVTGFLRALLELPDEPLELRRTWLGGAIAAFLGLCLLQLWHGLRAGYPLADAVAEFRVLLGLAVVLLALPIVGRAGQLQQLLRGLVAVGILLGAWGIAQWVFHLQFTDAATATAGTQFSTAGRTAGLYGFPAAIVLSLAAVTSGHVRRRTSQAALVAVAALNLAALALTFERTFWIGMAVGVAYLLARSSWPQRFRLLVGAPVVASFVVLALSLLGPAELHALGHRFASIGAYGSDPAYTYRQVESRMIERHIAAHPITGSGLGASQLIGRPGTTVQPKPRRYAENGYVWLAWKLGLPLAGFLVLILLSAAVWPQRGPPSRLRTLQIGSQSALVALCVSAATFSIFNSIAGPATLGILLVLIATPWLAMPVGGRDARQ